MRALGCRLLLGVIGALYLAACDTRSMPNVRLSGVSPTRGNDDAAVPVRVTGDYLLSRAVTDFGNASKSRVDEAFALHLIPADPSQPPVALQDVKRVSEETLTATVPPGPPRGLYGLRVTDPFGHEAFLSEVYRVVRSASAVSSFRITPVTAQVTGVPFMIEVAALDEAGGIVDGFSDSISLQDKTGALSPLQLGPFALGAARGQVVVTAVSHSDVVEAIDARGHLGRSNEFAVLSGNGVQLAFTLPSALEAGACSARIDVQIQDAGARPAASSTAISVSIEAALPDRFFLFSDAACSKPADTIEIPANATSAPFAFRTERAGTLALKASAAGLPSAMRTLTIDPARPIKVDFASPSQTLRVGACSSPLQVQTFDAFGNTSRPGASVPMSTAPQPPGVFDLFADAACSTPLPGFALGPDVPSAGLYVRANVAGAAYVQVVPPLSSGLAPASLALTVTP